MFKTEKADRAWISSEARDDSRTQVENGAAHLEERSDEEIEVFIYELGGGFKGESDRSDARSKSVSS